MARKKLVMILNEVLTVSFNHRFIATSKMFGHVNRKQILISSHFFFLLISRQFVQQIITLNFTAFIIIVYRFKDKVCDHILVRAVLCIGMSRCFQSCNMSTILVFNTNIIPICFTKKKVHSTLTISFSSDKWDCVK